MTWLEIKIFLREPLGAIGSIIIPVVLYVVLGRTMARGTGDPAAGEFLRFGVPLLTAVIRCLSESRISVADFRTVHPTLEDVFLKLTGHSIRD